MTSHGRSLWAEQLKFCQLTDDCHLLRTTRISPISFFEGAFGKNSGFGGERRQSDARNFRNAARAILMTVDFQTQPSRLWRLHTANVACIPHSSTWRVSPQHIQRCHSAVASHLSEYWNRIQKSERFLQQLGSSLQQPDIKMSYFSVHCDGDIDHCSTVFVRNGRSIWPSSSNINSSWTLRCDPLPHRRQLAGPRPNELNKCSKTCDERNLLLIDKCMEANKGVYRFAVARVPYFHVQSRRFQDFW